MSKQGRFSRFKSKQTDTEVPEVNGKKAQPQKSTKRLVGKFMIGMAQATHAHEYDNFNEKDSDHDVQKS